MSHHSISRCEWNFRAFFLGSLASHPYKTLLFVYFYELQSIYNSEHESIWVWLKLSSIRAVIVEGPSSLEKGDRTVLILFILSSFFLLFYRIMKCVHALCRQWKWEIIVTCSSRWWSCLMHNVSATTLKEILLRSWSGLEFVGCVCDTIVAINAATCWRSLVLLSPFAVCTTIVACRNSRPFCTLGALLHLNGNVLSGANDKVAENLFRSILLIWVKHKWVSNFDHQSKYYNTLLILGHDSWVDAEYRMLAQWRRHRLNQTAKYANGVNARSPIDPVHLFAKTFRKMRRRLELNIRMQELAYIDTDKQTWKKHISYGVGAIANHGYECETRESLRRKIETNVAVSTSRIT